MPILIWLLVWALMGTPAVDPPNAWFLGLLAAIVLTFWGSASRLDR